MFKKSKESNSSDEELNNRRSPFWKTRSSDDLTKMDLENINDVDRYLENRLERGYITRSEVGDNGKVENHFQEQLAETPEHQLESVRATHEQFWQDLRMDRDSYLKQIVGTNGLSRFAEPHFTNRVLDRRGLDIRSNKWPGVEVPNIDPQASPRFASLSCSAVNHVKQPVSTAEQGKQQVSIVEQPLPRVTNQNEKANGVVLVGVGMAVGISLVWRYSSQLFKSIKNLLKKWF